ncbi:MAG: 4Fe-4S binding protein [Candidatus Kariarchaeaceae archaeon]|jgi:heterodisulfide reductase subunit A
MDEPRIGVYVCHCGTNIAGVVNIDEVIEHAKTMDNVVLAKDSMFTCSITGQNMISEDIKSNNLNRVVVAACSPHMHEITFRNAVMDGGLNPHLLEIANIREHSSWVHPNEPAKATTKAIELVNMAVSKARLLDPLEKTEADVIPKILVIGGGIAGLKSTLDVGSSKIDVDLVEKSPTIGGNGARIGKLPHTNKTGGEVVGSLISTINAKSNIKVFTTTEVTKVDGSFGDYQVEITENPRYVSDACTSCDKCTPVCPVEVSNEYQYGMDTRKAIFKPFENAFPTIYTIDMDSCTKCGECVKVCEPNAINLEEQPRTFEESYGTIVVASGYKPYEPEKGEFGYGLDDKVITLFQLQRLLDSDAPSNGSQNLLTNAKNVVYISCVGSMEDPSKEGARTYCSRMCCSASFKTMIMLKEKYPNVNIHSLYQDIRTYARKDERMYEDASAKMVVFSKYTSDSEPKVLTNGDLKVEFHDPTLKLNLLIEADLVVLAVGMLPADGAQELKSILKVSCGPEGFFTEAHAKLRPVEVAAPGIYIAGTSHAPKDVIETVRSASAAASKAVIPLIKGKVELEPQIAVVNEEMCGRCGMCEPVCPYGAISYIEKEGREVSNVDHRLCAGCGSCAASCPAGAMQQFNHKDKQINEMIRAIGVKQ